MCMKYDFAKPGIRSRTISRSRACFIQTVNVSERAGFMDYIAESHVFIERGFVFRTRLGA
jgi:hypothetical protein